MEATLKCSRFSLFALALIMFVNGAGQAIMLPILAETLIKPTSDILIVSSSVLLRNVLWGLALGSFFLARFFGSMVLLEQSRKRDYKKILLWSLMCGAIGYLLSGLAFATHHISWLFIGRLMAGFAAGNQSVAQTAILNACNMNQRARYWRLTLITLTLGIIAGPLIGGTFCNHLLVSWFNAAVPMVVVAGLILFNIALFYGGCVGLMSVNETIPCTKKLVLQTLGKAITNKTIGYLTVAFLLLQLGWLIYYFHVSGFLMRTFSINETWIGIYIALIGVGLSLGFIRFADYWMKHWPLRKIVITGCLLHATGVLLCIIFPRLWMWWLLVLPSTVSFAIGYAAILMLFSLQNLEGSAHWLTTVTSFMITIAAILAPLLSGILASCNTNWPFWASVLLLVIGSLLLKRIKLDKAQTNAI